MAAKSLLFLTAVWTVIAEVPSLLEETIKRNPPTNIQISFGSFGEYTLSWDGNCTCEGNIYYQLDYKYLDSNDSKFDSFYLQVHRKKMNLELHRGIFAQVKLLYSEDNSAEISSNWTQGTFNLPRNSFASVYNLTCIFYGNMWMNCTWEIYNDGPEDAQYHLSYRKMHSNNLYNCSNYLVAGGRNIGCVGHKYDLALSYELIVCISEMNNKTKLPHCRRLQPSSFHKLDNPINVKINKSTDVVTWKLPEVNYNPICYKFQLNITNWSNGDQKVENVSATKYVISRDQTKKYSLQVRVLMNDKCLESTIWSDWSKPLIIVPDAKDMSVLIIAAVFAVIFVALALQLVFICIKFTLVSKVCQPIPDARKKFKGLFEEYNGDFQKWIAKNPQLTTTAEEDTLVSVKEL